MITPVCSHSAHWLYILTSLLDHGKVLQLLNLMVWNLFKVHREFICLQLELSKGSQAWFTNAASCCLSRKYFFTCSTTSGHGNKLAVNFSCSVLASSFYASVVDINICILLSISSLPFYVSHISMFLVSLLPPTVNQWNSMKSSTGMSLVSLYMFHAGRAWFTEKKQKQSVYHRILKNSQYSIKMTYKTDCFLIIFSLKS